MFINSFLKIAYFSLWRRKSRTILVILMLSFGLAAMIFSQGLYDGMIVQIMKDQIRTGTGELTIFKKGYEESKLLSDHIKDVQAIEDVLKEDGNVAHFVSRVRCEGVVSSARYAQGTNIIGIEVSKENHFINYKHPVVKGKFHVDGDNNQVMIGQKLAGKLKVDIGKKIVIQGQALNKEITATAARVVGILKTNNLEIDTAGVLMDKRKIQQLFKIDGVTEFSVLLKEESDLRLEKKKLEQQINEKIKEEVELFTWKELYPFLLLWDKIMKYFVYISYVIVFLVVALGIFFILFISIMERIKEFGILMAVGTPFSSIGKIVFLESLIMGGLGYIFGAFFGLLSLSLFNRFGLDLSYFSSGLSDVGMAAVMFPVIRAEYFIIGFIAMFVSSVMAGIIPLWKLKRLKAVEAIRFI